MDMNFSKTVINIDVNTSFQLLQVQTHFSEEHYLFNVFFK